MEIRGALDLRKRLSTHRSITASVPSLPEVALTPVP
ncbi:T0167155 isoform 1 [Pan troglodytes]|uniref:Uncharacterized protein n=2 Tax=Homininae TaxID=207598 RepID=A0A096LNJ8_HUMAN|nr:T0167155 isoform 1 [Pan troglodytes]